MAAKKPTKKPSPKGKSKSLLKKILTIVKWTMIIFFGSTILTAFIYKWVNPPITPLMVIRKIEGNPINKKWVNLKDISLNFPQAALTAEDPNFLTHHGFDFGAIEKAYNYNQKSTKKIKGGSTISQQTAKNVFLWPTRDYIRKGLEAYFTVLIEFIWGKERIMEVYLNVVETGPGIYGCEAASQKYFNKSCSKCSKSEAAAIICLLPSPRKYSVSNPSPRLLKHRNDIINWMGDKPVDFK